MNDPQVWTLIGVFAAVMLGGMTLMTTMFSRVIRAEIGGVTARFDSVDSKIDALRNEMNARFEAQDTKFSALDKEVANLATRLWGSGSH